MNTYKALLRDAEYKSALVLKRRLLKQNTLDRAQAFTIYFYLSSKIDYKPTGCAT